MTGQLFNDWLSALNTRMKREGRNILVIIDNAPVHVVNIVMSNITVHFLVANTTSVTQPCDGGIIRAWKANYRSRVYNYVLKNFWRCNCTDFLLVTFLIKVLRLMVAHAMTIKPADVRDAAQFTLTLWGALGLIKEARDSISQETIVNCWFHTGLMTLDNPVANAERVQEYKFGSTSVWFDLKY